MSRHPRVPITLYDEQVLDGWHRYCACEQTGTDPRYEEFKGTWQEAVRFVVGANVMRRHLSAGERADAAAAIANMRHGGSHKEQDAPVHLAEAADMFGVSERAVADAKAVAESDDEELKAQVTKSRLGEE